MDSYHRSQCPKRISGPTKLRKLSMDFYTYQENSYQFNSHLESVVLTKETNNLIHFVKHQAFDYMDQLEGWCTKSKASILIDLIFMLKPETIVEIGVFGGKSLVPMAYALKITSKGKIYGIDPWDNRESIAGMDGVDYDWWNSIDHGKILRDLQTKINKFELSNNISLLKTSSELASPIYNIDILHIDGNHSEKASFYDVTKWVPLVRKGGIIILDDTTWGTTEKAVQWLNDNCVKFTEFHDTGNDWGIWIKS